jgi:biotin transporter BioY
MGMKNKKAMGFFWLASLIVAFLVISIIASIFGLKFISGILEEIKWEYFVGALIVVLAFIFKDVVKAILMSILQIIKSVFNL